MRFVSNNQEQYSMERLTLTVPEFCEATCISKTTFYSLTKQGIGPTITKVGRKTLVSLEAAKEWQRRMEIQSH